MRVAAPSSSQSIHPAAYCIALLPRCEIRMTPLCATSRHKRTIIWMPSDDGTIVQATSNENNNTHRATSCGPIRTAPSA